ncbi:MAG TPA: protein-methionine-sulfoxide reductase heme-binding subunit MsrQ [Gemmatimonadales bacterium]|nr:protein-methionine-sulfoxide reductase heme-binding subunit MsrQ [Gemmatimonadales bacterium]
MPKLLKPAAFLLCAVPLLLMARDLLTGNLPAEPVKDLTHRTGFWGLFLITTTLAVTPLRRLTGWNAVQKLRRMIGLWGFAYIAVHFLIYLVLDQFFALDLIVEDVTKRPYITVGFTGFVMLIPLAITSTSGWVRRLGRRWTTLHALIYPIALAGVVHFFWSVKADTLVPTRFAVVLAALLGFRIAYPRLKSRLAARALRPRSSLAVQPADS